MRRACLKKAGDRPVQYTRSCRRIQLGSPPDRLQAIGPGAERRPIRARYARPRSQRFPALARYRNDRSARPGPFAPAPDKRSVRPAGGPARTAADADLPLQRRHPRAARDRDSPGFVTLALRIGGIQVQTAARRTCHNQKRRQRLSLARPIYCGCKRPVFI